MFSEGGRVSPEADPKYAHEYAVNMFVVTQQASARFSNTVAEQLSEQAQAYISTLARIASIDQQSQLEEDLSIEDLRFIYEIDQKLALYTVDSTGKPIADPAVSAILNDRDFVADMQRLYPEDDHDTIIEHLLEADRSPLVAVNLEKFDDLTGDTALRLIPEQGEYVAHHFAKFKDPDYLEVADLLMAHGHTNHLASIIDKLPGVDPFDVAHQLLYSGRGIDVLTHLKKFNGLDHYDFAKALIDTGQAQELVNHISEFVDVDYEELVEQIIAVGEGHLLDYQGLFGFHGLSDETKERLLYSGE